MDLAPAPFHADLAEGPAGARAHWVHTSDGLRIRLGHFPAEEPRGTVLLFPGRTEYIEKYGRTASDLAAGGYDTLCIDWRGQGLADRLLDAAVEILAPGGRLLLSVGPKAGEVTGTVEGAPVYHASLDAEDYRAILAAAGAPVETFVPEDPSCDYHSVLLARKPRGRPVSAQ